MKIAIVDDNEIFLKLVQTQADKIKQVNKDKIQVEVFNDPFKFLQLMKTTDVCEYEAVIIDIVMPDINGFEVRRQLKELCGELKCFLVTAKIYKEEIFGEYQSLIAKEKFNLRDIINNYKFISRFMNNLELDLYELQEPAFIVNE